MLITSIVRSAINYELLVASHDDVERQANVTDAFFFKEKDAFQNYPNSTPIFIPKFVACSADIVDRRVMDRLRTKSLLVVARWIERSWESI